MKRPVRIDPKADALIAVDVQPTFMPGGGLAVEGGDEVVSIIRGLMTRFDRDRRFATLDRHPRGHISLASSYNGLAPMEILSADDVGRWDANRIAVGARFSLSDLKRYLAQVGSQILWPDHALDGTAEAELHPELSENDFAFVQVKGADPLCDSYSGFYDNLRRRTGFDGAVANSGAKRLFICGLALDFCVGWTALDARKALPKTDVFVIEDACRSVAMPGSVARMTQDLLDVGIRIVHSNQLVS